MFSLDAGQQTGPDLWLARLEDRGLRGLKTEGRVVHNREE